VKRRLILLRHAKSDWKAGAPTDQARPINARGRRDSPRVAVRIAELGWIPTHIWSSDATRTRETVELMLPRFKPAPKVSYESKLYLGDLRAMRKVMGGVSDKCKTAMLVGHNPGWEEAASLLTGLSINMTTCNAILLTVKADSWSDALAMESAWKLNEHILPRALKKKK